MSDPTIPPVEHPAKKLQRFIQSGGDLSTVPDDAWNAAGGAPFKDRVQRFVAAGGDVREVHIPTPTPAELMPADVERESFPEPLAPDQQRMVGPGRPEVNSPLDLVRVQQANLARPEAERSENQFMAAQGFRARGGGPADRPARLHRSGAWRRTDARASGADRRALLS